MYEPSARDRVVSSPALVRRRWVGRTVGGLLGRVHVDGLANVPAHGPVVFAMNHQSFIDGPLLFGYVERPVNLLVKSEAFSGMLAPVLRSAGAVAVVRDAVDPTPVRQCLQILRSGGIVGIFPEGSRGAGRVHTTRPGAAYLALRSGAVVLPVAAHGTAGLTHWHGPRRPTARLTIGGPIAVRRWPDDQRLNHRFVAALAEQLRAVLAELVAQTIPDDQTTRSAA